MHESSHPGRQLSLDQLRADHPGYEIERDPRRDPPRYVASTHDLSLTPSAIVTADLDELGRELAAERRDRAAGAGGTPAIRNRAAEIVSELEAAWPGWQIWVVHRVIGGPVWCARRQGWRPGMPVYNAPTPEDLAGCLEDESRGSPGTREESGSVLRQLGSRSSGHQAAFVAPEDERPASCPGAS